MEEVNSHQMVVRSSRIKHTLQAGAKGRARLTEVVALSVKEGSEQR
jgi:hypothetical protein